MKNNNPSNFKVGDTLQSKEWGEFKIVEYINARYITIMFLNTGNKYVRQKGEIVRGAVCDRDVIVERLKPTKISKLNKSNSFDKFMESWDKTTHRKDVFKLPYFSYCKVNGWVYKGFTYVDKYTYEFASKLKCIKNSYIQFTLSKDNCRRLGIIKPSKKTTLPLHSWVKAMPTGVKDLVTDHKNGCKLDNRMHNLRVANCKENAGNSKSNAKSGYKGVKFKADKPRTKPWYAGQCEFIEGEQVEYSLGYFANKEDAAKAVDIFNIERYGEFVRLNLKRSIYEDMGLLPKTEKKYKLP
jgi:hypothetical protein